MKIRTAVETLFSDAETSVSSRVEIVSFLRRYASGRRPITHYSCRGNSTNALKKMLLIMGLRENDDFKIVSSKLDPEFNQIRWAQDLKGISEVVNGLVASTRGNDALFDALYVNVTKKLDTAPLTSKLCDSEGGQAIVTAPSMDENHLAARILRTTSKIVVTLAALFKSYDEEGKTCGLLNSKLAIATAREFLEKNFNLETGEPLNDKAPYILPLSVLELYTRIIVGTKGPNGMRGDTLVFKTSPLALDLFRLVRKDEKIVWDACLSAPLDYLWNIKDPTDKNPLHGYFFRSGEAVKKADLRNKIGVLIGGNAALIHDKEADDNVTPALCTSNHRDFWDYVLRVYRAAYDYDAGLSCRCRVGIPVRLPVWDKDVPPEGATSIVLGHESAWNQGQPSPILAEYAVFLGLEIDCSFGDAYSFLDGTPPLKVMVVTESNTPDFSVDYLTKDELAWEWFAMTHLDDSASAEKQYTYTYSRSEASNSHTAANMAVLKKVIHEYDAHMLAEKSEYNLNTCFTPIFSDLEPYPNYTSLSAFLEGICVCSRKAWSPDARSVLPLKAKTLGHRTHKSQSDLIITNVYSGVFTDLSPLVGSGEDTGDVFPNPLLSNSKKLDGCMLDTTADRDRMTAFLDRMANGDTMEQVKFAKRTTDTPRYFATLVETNIDASMFFVNVNATNLETALGTVFLQTMVLNNTDPACAFDGSAISESEGRRTNRNHDIIRKCCHNFWPKIFSGASDYRLPSGVYSPNAAWGNSSMLVTARKDADGRLVLIFVASGNLMSYARLCYRYRCGFPFETTLTKEKMYEGAGGYDVPLKKDALLSLDSAVSIIKRQITTRCHDYHGYGNRSSGGEGDTGPLFRMPMHEVPLSCAPSRAWFINNSTLLDCSCVFDSF